MYLSGLWPFGFSSENPTYIRQALATCFCMSVPGSSLDEAVSHPGLCPFTAASVMVSPQPTMNYEGCPSSVSSTRKRNLMAVCFRMYQQEGFRYGNVRQM